MAPAVPAARVNADPRVSVVIPTKDNPAMLRTLLDGLRATAPEAGVVVVDNGSQNPAVERVIASAAAQTVHVQAPFNFSLLVNAGAAACRGEYLLLLNDDIQVGPDGWLEEMLAVAEAGTGPVGAVLLYRSGLVQHWGIAMTGDRPEPLGVGVQPAVLAGQPPPAPDAVTGACMLVRRALFTSLGGFKPLLRTNYNDVDFCLRAARAGHPPALASAARLVHHESATRGKDSTPEVRADWLMFRTRWAHLLDQPV